ncbi:MAG: AIR synthase-related protein, partial [Balneolaceae bacterium]
ILPEGLSLKINWFSWERPVIFNLIRKTGNVPEEDMRSTFNLGIGLVVVVDGDSVSKVKKMIEQTGEKAVEIGVVE